MATPYICPRHSIGLVARVLTVHTVRGGVRHVRYFACPHVAECELCDGCGWLEGFCRNCDGTGVIRCDYLKPDKWQRRRA